MERTRPALRRITETVGAGLAYPARRVRFLRSMPRELEGGEMSRATTTVVVLAALGTVATLASLCEWSAPGWMAYFLIGAFAFDYSRMWNQSASGAVAGAEVPFMLVTTVLLPVHEAALVLLATAGLTAVMFCKCHWGMVRIVANAARPVVTLLGVAAARSWFDLGSGSLDTLILLGVALGAYFVGSAVLWIDIAFEDGVPAWLGLIRSAVVSEEELIGGAGNIATVLPIIVAAHANALLLTSMVVPYMVMWRAAHAQERLSVVEKKIGIDALTGLFNREKLNEHVASEIEAVERYGHALGLVMGDLDNFKRVNDTLGHLSGDEVLRRCATVFRELIKGDARLLAARYGGEEFVIVATTVSRREFVQLTEDLRGRVHDALHEEFGTSISLGFAYWNQGETANEWIDRADKALYSAKMAGKNRVHEWPAGGDDAVPVQPLRAA